MAHRVEMPRPPLPSSRSGRRSRPSRAGVCPADTHEVPPTPVTNGWLAGSSTASVSSEYAARQTILRPLVAGGGEDTLALGRSLLEEDVLGIGGVAALLGLALAPRGRDDRRLVVAHDGVVGVVGAGVRVRALVDDDVGVGGEPCHLLDVHVGLAHTGVPGRPTVDVLGVTEASVP